MQICKHCGTAVGEHQGIAFQGSLYVVNPVFPEEVEKVAGFDLPNIPMPPGIPIGTVMMMSGGPSYAIRHVLCWKCFFSAIHVSVDEIAKSLLS